MRPGVEQIAANVPEPRCIFYIKPCERCGGDHRAPDRRAPWCRTYTTRMVRCADPRAWDAR